MNVYSLSFFYIIYLISSFPYIIFYFPLFVVPYVINFYFLFLFLFACSSSIPNWREPFLFLMVPPPLAAKKYLFSFSFLLVCRRCRYGVFSSVQQYASIYLFPFVRQFGMACRMNGAAAIFWNRQAPGRAKAPRVACVKQLPFTQAGHSIKFFPRSSIKKILSWQQSAAVVLWYSCASNDLNIKVICLRIADDFLDALF